MASRRRRVGHGVGTHYRRFCDESFGSLARDDDSAVGAGGVMLLPIAAPDFAQPTINVVGRSGRSHRH